MQRMKDMLGDLLMTIAIWCDSMAGKLYDKRRVDDAMRELDRLIDEAAENRAEPIPVTHGMDALNERRRTSYLVGAVIDGRVASVWLPKGTMWVEGGSC